jgi:hypothetical protein
MDFNLGVVADKGEAALPELGTRSACREQVAR